jgi:allophanate hydrolase subunit 1
MKIAHFQVNEPKAGGRVAALTARIERLRGVVGVVAVRSMGLLTVLYDERRIDPVAISDTVVEAEAEPAEEPAPAVPVRSRTHERLAARRVPIHL